jgi:two-component system, NarL family, sensor histidine kinase DegS
MTDEPYTRDSMDAARTGPEPGDAREGRDALSPGPGHARDVPDAREPRDPIDARIDGLHAEAGEAIGYSANVLRSVRERYRTAYGEALGRWQALSDELDELERRTPPTRPRLVVADSLADDDPGTGNGGAAAAAEAGAEDARVRTLRSDVGVMGRELGTHQTDLAKLDIALRNLETTWLFLKRGDGSLVGGGGAESLPSDVQMRIVEALEAERSRLAQEVHDGPAQTLSNAIFQVEYLEGIVAKDTQLARTELRFLREQLRRELGSVRTFISQLRPPVLDELGLTGAVTDAVGRMTALTGIPIRVDLAAPSTRLTETQQTVVLRVVQEALQNVRKHSGASSVVVASEMEGDDWLLSVRDDGRGFDVGAVAARGRRNFGLQFMQERAELIGARFEVHSRPDGGTLVRLAIPVGAEESGL